MEQTGLHRYRSDTTGLRRSVSGNRGAALVEFAISAILLMTLVFGIIEFGLIMKDYLALSQATREGVRSAALGNPRSVWTDALEKGAAGLSDDQISKLTASLYYRTYTPPAPGGQGVWTDWTAWGGEILPTVPAGQYMQFMVRAECPHETIAGSLLGLEPEITLRGSMVMRRE